MFEHILLKIMRYFYNKLILYHFIMKSVVQDLTSETIGLIYKECSKEKNKHKIQNILNNIIEYTFENIKPYLYTIMAILILLFLINTFQFYYYIKLFTTNNKLNIQDINT